MRQFQRFFSPPKGSYFLFGPRGTGKSTWIKEYYKQPILIDLLQPEIRRKYIANPEFLTKLVNAHPDQNTIVIDEVQKAPELLTVVHSLIETKKHLQFVLTGSSARKLRQKEVDLLGGRAIKCSMHPFMASELKSHFSLENALNRGMLPLIIESFEPERSLEAYVDLYVMEEVQFEGLVRDIGSFARFLSVIAFSHGSILNISNISNECQVKRATVENYLTILNDLLLCNQVPVFTKRAKRHLISHPKLYLFDAGIYRTLREFGPADQKSEMDGITLEGLIFQHLKAWCDYSKERFKIYYWRTKSGLEVDFIIYGPSGFWAIEVKNSSRVKPQDLRGLIHFQEDYPEAKLLLLYRGKERFIENGILCMPSEEFLQNLTPSQDFL